MSSNDSVIRINELSKCYEIYASPHDRLKQFFLPRIHSLLGKDEPQYFRPFWAVSGVSVEIRRGETVGIIGKNGSGKSTLLQMICGTLSPTHGSVETHGRIAALLELGSGFNPEFTGRENVYMNAEVLGLSRQDIIARFDEIAAFADIGDFIDQPVKMYSSGMFVRLAFAVQASVRPDILIVDEALAVGDIGFQYKCFKRIKELRDKGVTILMVTHSTGSILEFADRCIVMQSGRVVCDTRDVLSAVLAYEKGLKEDLALEATQLGVVSNQFLKLEEMTASKLSELQVSERNVELGEKRFGSARAIIRSVSVLKNDGVSSGNVSLVMSGDAVTFSFRVLSSDTIPNVVLGVSLSRAEGVDVWGDNNVFAGQPITLMPGENIIEYSVRLPINTGEYLVHCGLACFHGEEREELDQRRPIDKLRFWSSREQVGVLHAPIKVSVSTRGGN